MFAEKPPILSGNNTRDLVQLRDWLFRLSGSLDEIATAGSGQAVTVSYDSQGRAVEEKKEDGDMIERLRKNAQELKALIVKSAENLTAAYQEGDAGVISYTDSREEVYNGMYLAKSEFGTFQENVTSMIETTAMGVVESYGYDSLIVGVQDSIDLLQAYYENIDGEIKRGIVLDPDTGSYVTGIAISQNAKFKAAISQAAEAAAPDDGYTYYELESGQTFGLYTSTGWQFWIDGYKKGWYNSQDGMLHVANVLVEDVLQIGGTWKMKSNLKEFEITYIGS